MNKKCTLAFGLVIAVAGSVFCRQLVLDSNQLPPVISTPTELPVQPLVIQKELDLPNCETVPLRKHRLRDPYLPGGHKTEK